MIRPVENLPRSGPAPGQEPSRRAIDLNCLDDDIPDDTAPSPELADLARAVRDLGVIKPTKWCRFCRYPLDGVEGHRCPECGHPFTKQSVLTDNETRGRRALRTAGWLAAGGAVVFALIMGPRYLIGVFIALIVIPLAIGAVRARRGPYRRLPRCGPHMQRPWFMPGYSRPDDR